MSTLEFGLARASELTELVGLLADDPLGAKRERAEDPLPDAYAAAFQAIEEDPNQELVVARSGGSVVGMLQITFIPSLTYVGSWRAQIEGVRVRRELRGAGVGARLLAWARERAEGRGCRLLQLTTDKARPEALLFYERLGYRASHEGMKLPL
jgi:GNAT superfamily N-acetyltransferase